MSLRPNELEHVEKFVDFLSINYPEHFKKGEYTHPVKGACKSMIFEYDGTTKEIDLENILKIEIYFDTHTITIETDVPVRTFVIKNFIIDKTVI